MHRYQLSDTLHGILQDVVSPLECLLHRYVCIGIHVAESLVVDNQQRVNVLPQLVHTLQRLHNLTLLLEVERYRHHTYCQQTHSFRHASYHRSRTRSGTATHASRHKDHLRAVAQQLLDIIDIALGLLPTKFRISTGPKTRRTQHDFHRHRRTRQRLAVRVTDGKCHALHAFLVHVSDGITATAAHTNHLDDAPHRILNHRKIQQSKFFSHIVYLVSLITNSLGSVMTFSRSYQIRPAICFCV